jgi:CMP-N,N'-diacetyllegionaminic acid synthase
MKALIAVRSGSTRVKDKNIRPFAGLSLLALKVIQLNEIIDQGYLSEVIVNSNCDEMLDIATSLGATAQKRCEEHATSDVPMFDVWTKMAKDFPDDDIAYCCVTNPLVTNETLIQCIKIYNGEADKSRIDTNQSVNTVCDVKEYLWHMDKRTGNHRPLNYNPNRHIRSQDLPDIVNLTYACSIIPRKRMMEIGNVVTEKPYFYVTNPVESLDIDTQLDFDFAEYLYNRLHK